MKELNVDRLLEKYWEGNTSLEEEQALRHYFLEGEPEERHLVYRDLFTFFREEKSITFPGTIAKPARIIRQRYLGWTGIAASILLIVSISVVIVVNRYDSGQAKVDPWAKYEVNDPQLAKAATENALVFLSTRMRKGERELEENMRPFRKLPFK